jgi:hypothetical protein
VAQLYGDEIIPQNGEIAVPQGARFGLERRANVICDYRRVWADRPEKLAICRKESGMGETGTAIVPALANAIFGASRKRLRKMPIDTTALKRAGVSEPAMLTPEER